MRLRASTLPGILLRRGLQLSVLAFVAYAAMGGMWRNFKVAHNSARLVGLMEGDSWATAYATNEDALSVWGEEPYRASFDFLGMPWAATVFGVETADPILAGAHVLSTGALVPGLLLAALGPLVLAFFLGKVFCSHLCPMRLAFELGQIVRGGLLRLRVPLPRFRSSWRLGGWVLVGGLLATVLSSTAVWLLVLPYVNLVAGLFLLLSTGTAAGLLTVVVGWWLVDVLVAPGLFCHTLCPQGALLEQVGRWSWLRLRKRPVPPCPTKCHVCAVVCPYGLSPRRGDHRPACDNCGQCVSACPEGKLYRRLHLPVLAAALAAMLWPAAAQAHHNKGLPHYGYFENYPQVPTQELIVVDGRWELGATVFNFQGYERHDSDAPNDVKFFVYLYDLQADQSYDGPVEFELVLDGETVATFTRETVDEELIYSTRETLPRTGDYVLRAHITDPSRPGTAELPFFVDLQEDAVPWGWILALVLPLVPLLGLAVLGRTRKGRARWMRDRAAVAPPPEVQW